MQMPKRALKILCCVGFLFFTSAAVSADFIIPEITAASHVQAFCSRSFRKLAFWIKYPPVTDYKWVENSMPSEALWKNTISQKSINAPLPSKGAPVYYFPNSSVTKAILTQLKLLQTIDGKDYVTAPGAKVSNLMESNGEYEQQLLAQATLDSKPHEPLQLRLFFGREVASTSNVVRGTETEVSPQLIPQLKAAVKATPTTEIELNHVHPIASYLIPPQEGEPKQFRMALPLLSAPDLQTGVLLSTEFPGVLVTIRAITSAGVTYSASFRDGKVVPPAR